MNTLVSMVLALGIILIIVGIAFILPCIAIGKLSASTRGLIKDITYDAASYNKRVAAKMSDLIDDSPKRKVYVSAGVGGHHDISGDPKKMYHAIYSYTVNGVEYSKADGTGYNKGIAMKKIGSEVKVHYDPENPLKASLSSGLVYKVLSCSFIPAGAFIIIVGLLLLKILQWTIEVVLC